MAVEAHTTRRALFAIASAATLLPAAVMAAPGENAARLLHLERQRNESLRRLDSGNLSESEVDREAARVARCELEIAAAPCDSRDAMLVKLRTVIRTGMVYGQLDEIDDAALIDGVIAFAEGRH